jgi:hypothetical protein
VVDDYSFRIRVNRAPTDTINIQSSSIELSSPISTEPVIFSSGDKSKTIQQSDKLVLRCAGWSTSKDALTAGQVFRDVLMRTLARLRVGADFGARAPKGLITEAGLALLEQQFGERIINDMHGLMVYPTERAVRFALLGTPSLVRGVSQELFEKVFSMAMSSSYELPDRERLAFDLYNSSFFQQTADARFLLLVMAVEALLEMHPRSDVAREHVEHLVSLTQTSEALSRDEKQSLLGSLRGLRSESIGQAGRRLVKERLGMRTYMERKPSKFFSHVYSLRSRLVHGATPYPDRDEVASVAATLEVFVSDLLSRPLLDASEGL